MKRYTYPLALFFAATGLTFVATFTLFIVLERHSILTEPRTYIEGLKRTGSSNEMIPLAGWKHFLAQDQLCREAESIVIGSSRVREIEQSVVGTSVCNLYVDGLATAGLLRLAQALPPVTPGNRAHLVYVGLDHFWYLREDDNPLEDVNIMLIEHSPALWRAWAVGKTLGFFQWRDIVEAVRRYREGPIGFEKQHSVFYADGHLYHPEYYAQKRAGFHAVFTQAVVENEVNDVFGTGRRREPNLRRLETGVRLLHDKGYAVRLYWNPVTPAHLEAAQRHYPELFQQTIEAIDRVAVDLPLDRYVPANQTLDAARFGCTNSDYFDTTHVDVDCMRRMYAAVFNIPAGNATADVVRRSSIR